MRFYNLKLYESFFENDHRQKLIPTLFKNFKNNKITNNKFKKFRIKYYSCK